MSAANTQFSIWDVFKNLLGLLVFVLLIGWGMRTIPVNPRVGWFATLLFGFMSLLVIVNIVQICGRDEPSQSTGGRVKSETRIAFVQTGTFIVSIFLGIADNFIGGSEHSSFLRPKVWLAAFVTTLAFYPLRGEQKKDLPNFSYWAIYCALAGVLSVVISYLSDWLEKLLKS